MKTDVAGSLNDERRQGFEILDLVVAQGLENAPKRFLGNIFCRGAVTKPPGSEGAQALPETLR